MRNTRQRRQQILQTLVEHGNVQVSELVTRFSVSAVTIRADLTHIESQGLATRTHGGATLVRTPPQEQDIHEKDALNLPM
jgi:DeoR family transcriptional regulator of aga operon